MNINNMNENVTSKTYCKCGCARELVVAKRNKYRKKLPIFISGHNSNTPEGLKHTREILHSNTSRIKSSITKKKLYAAGKLTMPSRKGCISPNKGKNIMPENAKQHLREINLGKKHSKETKDKIKQYALNNGFGKWMKGRTRSIELVRKSADKLVGKMPKNTMRVGKFGNIKRGYYNIGNGEMFFRSKWEANYALYLNFLKEKKEIAEWEYEADTFIFHNIQFGTRSYTPDFKITNNNGTIEFHEIKGWMDDKSRTKLKRMDMYYPDIKLILITGVEYRKLKSQVGGLLHFY